MEREAKRHMQLQVQWRGRERDCSYLLLTTNKGKDQDHFFLLGADDKMYSVPNGGDICFENQSVE